MDASQTAGPAFKDRRTGLVVFGVSVVLVGLLCALLGAVGVVASWLMAADAPREGMDASAILPGMSLYLLMAVALVWLGIGSIRMRRWARALLVIVSWIWLLTGALGIVMIALMLPAMVGQAGAPTDMPGGMQTFMAVFMVIFGMVFIAFPGMLVLFYRSPHVKATVEAADPVVRWTDRCPPAVLALTVALALGVVSLVPQAFARPAFPLFGTILTGHAGTAAFLLVAALWAYCTWATYRMESKGWWTTTISFAAGIASAATTYLTRDMTEVYRSMGYPEQQVEQIRAVNSTYLIVFAAIMSLLFFAYLIYMKRYFTKSTPRPGLGAP